MQIASLVLGVLSIIGMFVAFIPCFGALNWINIPFAIVGLIVSVLALSQKSLPGESKSNAKIGIVLCGIAIVFGMMRLLLGGGVL